MMQGSTRRRAGAVAAVLLGAGALLCRPIGVAGGPVQAAPQGGLVTTKHQIAIDGRVLKYTAKAGHLPILDNETGEAHGHIFFTAYTLDRTAGTGVRPLTFLWNGGPGSSSSLVHLLGFGPRTVRAGAPPVDNPGTWLDFTDLVFVDPVGTGYSRPTKAEYGPEFYQTRGDAESVAEFIRVYRNRFEAWDAPLFLAGESYGVTRAAGVADVLERKGIGTSGAVLIGLALPLGQLSDDLRTALMVPSYTAAAFANRKLPPDLQRDVNGALRESEAWARGEYAGALARRGSLADSERQAVLARLSRFTGLDVQAIDAKTLAIGMAEFAERLLAGEQKVVGRYDTRLVGPADRSGGPYDPTRDPSLKNIIDDVAVIRYFRSELQFESDLPYQGPFGGGYPPATEFRGDWMSVRWNRSQAAGARGRAGPGGAPDQPLGRAMTANPRLKVLVACGHYDLVCAYAANDYVAGHLESPFAARVISKSYGGGHAIYTDPAAQRAMKKDVADFVARALDGTRRAGGQP